MVRFHAGALAAACLIAVAALSPNPVLADDAQDSRQLVEKARLTFEAFVADKEMGRSLRSLLKRAKGLYAGLSLEGAVVATRDGLNRAYYGKEVTPTDILIRRAVTNSHAASLIGDIAKVTGGK